MIDESRQSEAHGVLSTSRAIKLPTRCSARRRSDPVPIGVAVAEACAEIAVRARKTALRLRTQTAQALRNARATG
jgi:hypothetical protein